MGFDESGDGKQGVALMLFSRKYPRFDESLLWSRITRYCDNAVRVALQQQYKKAETGVYDPGLEAGCVAPKPATYFHTKGGALAYVIGPTAPEHGSHWLGYIVDEQHGVYHEFNEWWASGQNALAGPMRVFDLASAVSAPPKLAVVPK